MNRRQFLAGSAGLVALAACNRGGGERADITVPGGDDPSQQLNVVLATSEFVSGSDQRVAFAVLRGTEPIEEPAVQVAFAGATGEFASPLRAPRRTEGIEARPFYRAEHLFPEPGVYRMRVNVEGSSAVAGLQVADPGSVAAPLPGESLVAAATPTVADPLGTDPLCTRVDPRTHQAAPCPFHDVSLEAALQQQRPIALLFATPARCQSQTCGPVLDILLSQRDAFPEVQFIHVEIFKAASGNDLVDAVRAYHLVSEPFLFLAGADGVVRQRIEGPFDRREARDALAALRG